MNLNPDGPTTRRLLEHMQKIAEHIAPDKSADRLEGLGKALIEAADKLRGDRPEMAFEGLMGEHFKTLVNLVLAEAIAQDLLEAARASDVEGN